MSPHQWDFDQTFAIISLSLWLIVGLKNHINAQTLLALAFDISRVCYFHICFGNFFLGPPLETVLLL